MAFAPGSAAPGAPPAPAAGHFGRRGQGEGAGATGPEPARGPQTEKAAPATALRAEARGCVRVPTPVGFPALRHLTAAHSR